MAVVAVLAGVPAGAAGVSAQGRPARAHILLFNFSLGWHHLSIPHGTQVLQKAMKQAGYDVTVSGNPEDLTAQRLAHTDAVVWFNTTGNGTAPFTTSQKQDFENWMRCGGGNVGIHAVAGPLFTGWPAWNKIWGSTEGGEPLTETSVADDQTPNQEGWGQFNVTVKVDDHSNPATAPWHKLPTFQMRDEWYHWKSDPSKVVPDFHQLLGFDGFTDPRTAMQYSSSGYWFDMPVAFTGSFAHTNRDFYTNLGHSTLLFDDRTYVEHVVGGLDWVTGVRPKAECLARHGMSGQTAASSARWATSVVTAGGQPQESTSGDAACVAVAQLTHTDKGPTSWRGALYGGMGDCNGQYDAACSLQSAECGDPDHASAGIEAGEYYIDPHTDLRYQEPALKGSGSCQAGNVSGTLFINWPDHRLTVLSVQTSGGLLSGTVLKSIKLASVPGQRDRSGRRVTAPLTLKTTEGISGSAAGSFQFQQCISAADAQVVGELTIRS